MRKLNPSDFQIHRLRGILLAAALIVTACKFVRVSHMRWRKLKAYSQERTPCPTLPKPSSSRPLPGYWFCAQVRRLPQGVRRIEGCQGRRGRGAKAQAAGADRRPKAHPEGGRCRTAQIGRA